MAALTLSSLEPLLWVAALLTAIGMINQFSRSVQQGWHR